MEREIKSINTGMSVALDRIQSDLGNIGISRQMHIIEKAAIDGVITDRNAKKNIAGLVGNRLKSLAEVIVSQARLQQAPKRGVSIQGEARIFR
ncbi:MAG: hypothetical protein HQL08_07825 [Nitrospirae bacterium]|nr:hypothetical protein [Nitrospirota bacterium]